MRSFNSRDASDTKRSGGIHGMSRWQSAEILRYCIRLLRATGLALRPTVLPSREHLLAVRLGSPCRFRRCDMTETHRYSPSRGGLRLHANYDIHAVTST